MVLQRIGFPLALLLALSLTALGDAVILQTGERVEGKILRQNDEAIVIEVMVSSGIIDTRTYQKSEVKTVEKEAPDQIAYPKIAGLRPGPDSLMPAGYDRALAQLRAFQRQFPKSSFLPAVEENIAALTAEKTKVEEGSVKLGGQWLTAEEVQKNRYQIEARSVFGQMQVLAKGGDYIAALNAFDTIETQYPGSTSYPEAVLLARQIVPILRTELARKKIVAATEEKKRVEGVEITSEPQKSQLIAAYEAEQAQFKALLDEAAASKIKWVPLIQRSPESLEALEKMVETENTRLIGVNVTGMQTSIAALGRAEAAMGKDDLELAQQELEAAKTSWPANEALKNIGETLAEREKAAAAAAVPVPATAESPAPAATPAAPAPTAAESPSPAATPTPAAATPPPAAATPAGKPAAAVTPVEEERPFYKTVGGAAIIAAATLAVAGAVALLGKIKKPADEEEPKE